jgi:hypothetical protein
MRSTLARAAALALGFCFALGCTAGTRQAPAFALDQLTLPPGKLPPGCGLKPVNGARGLLPVRSNPEITTDSITIGSVRALIAPPRDMQIPLNPEAAASTFRSLARGIVAAYVATYTEPGAPEIGVYGLKFAAPLTGAEQQAIVSQPRRLPGMSFYIDDVIAFVWVDGDSGICHETVLGHVGELALARDQ